MANAPAAATDGATVIRPPRVDFPSFDGFRAIAAVSVLITHVSFSSGLNNRGYQFDVFGFHPAWLNVSLYLARLDVGVAIFFLISGFLLYRPFVAAHLAGGPRPATIPYFWRRALRIYPAYWLATSVAVYGFHVGEINDVKSFFLYYSLTHTYSLGNVIAPLAQSWSLVTEVAFYLFLPVWAAAMRVWGGGPARRLRAELVGLAGLCALSIGYKLFVLWSDMGDGRKGQLLSLLPSWLDLFTVGMALAVLSAWITQRDLRTPFGLGRAFVPVTCWVLAAASFFTVSTQLDLPRRALENFTPGQWLGEHYLYGTTAFFLLLPGMFGPQGRGAVRVFLRSRVMVFLGLISYGLYLWHDLLIHEFLVATNRTHGLAGFTSPFGAMFVWTFALTTATAAISYYVIERPILRLKDLPSRLRRALPAPVPARAATTPPAPESAPAGSDVARS